MQQCPDNAFGLSGTDLDPIGAGITSDRCAPRLWIIHLVDLEHYLTGCEQRPVIIAPLDSFKQAPDPLPDLNRIVYASASLTSTTLGTSAKLAGDIPLSDSADKRKLEEELNRLRAENEQLRSLLRVESPAALDEKPSSNAAPRVIRVLLLPDPSGETKAAGPGPQAIANVARVLVKHLQERQPARDWRAEFDLQRIPPGVLCHQLGDALRRLWDGTGPLPPTFVVTEDHNGRRLRRRLVATEPESECFRDGYQHSLADANDLLQEGEAAFGAAAFHHATWALKAGDVILARVKLAWTLFEEGESGWRDVLAEARPEYEPAGAPG